MRISDWSSDVCSSDLVEPDCDRVLGGRGPRQAALAPEREALAQRVVDFAVGAGAAPGLVRIEATESTRARRAGQGARRQGPCLSRLGLEVPCPSLGVVFAAHRADRLYTAPRAGSGTANGRPQPPHRAGEPAGEQGPGAAE